MMSCEVFDAFRFFYCFGLWERITGLGSLPGVYTMLYAKIIEF